MPSSDIKNSPTAEDLMCGDDQQQINRQLAEVVIQLRQELQSANARLGHLEHEQGEFIVSKSTLIKNLIIDHAF